ncbi:uncharacterized protein LOC122015046 isoform X2 [Zingiber officinale]|nr:uncharacterized protein LOC122015046 isoform X2 [Zingiber officinale]
MEDWNQAEIEDIVFGNIGENNDQIFSDRGGKQVEESLAPGNFIVAQQSNKTNIGNSAGSKVSKNKDAIWRKQGTNICSSLENESSNVAKGDCQGNTVSQSKMCSSSNPATRNAEEEMGICQLPFENNSSVDSKVTFLANENDLYYGWSDISSFDDVDKMFRNCDPTFGQWSNTDGPSWISSSEDMYGPEDKFTSTFKSSTLEFKELENASVYCENSRCLDECSKPQVDTHRQSCLTCPSFKSSAVQAYDGGGGEDNKSSLTPCSTNNLVEHEPQIDIQTQQQLNRQFLSDAKGKGLATYPAQLHSKRDCIAKSDCSSLTLSLNPDFHVDNKLLYQDLLLQSASGTVTDCKQDPSSSFEVSAHVINNSSHGMGKVPDALLNNPVMKLEEMVDSPNIRSLELGNSVRKQHANFGQNIHNDRGNTSIEIHEKDMDPAVGKNSLMPSIFLDNLSVKVISFQQLQGVIGQVCLLQLEYRTKLCIRDSLYRLARSAEQRHNCAAANAEGVDHGREIHGTGTSNRSVEYMGIETESNPIDRSVARLLFYRAPETATR